MVRRLLYLISTVDAIKWIGTAKEAVLKRILGWNNDTLKLYFRPSDFFIYTIYFSFVEQQQQN